LAQLRASDVPVAETTALLLAANVPQCARVVLGISDPRKGAGAPPPNPAGVPISRALAGLAVRREPLEVKRTEDSADDSDARKVIRSAALLRRGRQDLR
jgi:hypothetical protein